MSRKQYRMIPELFLQLGPDRFHTTRMGPLAVNKVLRILSMYPTPEAAYRAHYAQESETALHDMISEAIYDWNQQWAEEEGPEHITGWEWLGLCVRAKADGVDVWVSAVEDEPGICTVYVDEALMESKARTCALAALAALQPLMKPEGDR